MALISNTPEVTMKKLAGALRAREIIPEGSASPPSSAQVSVRRSPNLNTLGETPSPLYGDSSIA